MKVAIASDHAGFEMKSWLARRLIEAGHDLDDLGPAEGGTAVDYPDFAEKVALAVRDGHVERGIVLCGSGVGASVAANKVRGVRAAVCHDAYSAHQGVEHDDMNVLVLGARIIGPALAWELAEAFLRAEFTAEERHVRRLAKVRALEERF